MYVGLCRESLCYLTQQIQRYFAIGDLLHRDARFDAGAKLAELHPHLF